MSTIHQARDESLSLYGRGTASNASRERADTLLAHFDRISDAPDAVARLRRFILDLAVRGKLVEQDPTDEPTSILLKRIEREKVRRLKGGSARNEQDYPQLELEEVPFPIDRSLLLVRLHDIAQIEKGSTAIQKSTPGPYPLVVLSEHRSSSSEYQFDTSAAIVPLVSSTGHGHASIHRLHYQEGKFALGNILCAVIPFDPSLISARYIYEYLSSYKEDLLISKMTGTANVSLTIGKIADVPIPIPTRRAQQRLYELMALCDELEAARTEREGRRDALIAASLHRLTDAGGADGDPEEAREQARFHLDNLPRLVTRPEHMRGLRQTILNLAVRGRLVPQDPNDEPAIRLGRFEPVESVPFEIPDSWRWVPLRTLGKLKGGGTPSKADDRFWNGTIPWVSPKDMKQDYIASSQLSITDEAVRHSAVHLIEPGSILFVVRGMILAHSFPVAIATAPLTINQDMKALTLQRSVMGEFMLRTLKGLKPLVLSRVQRSTHGTCRLEGNDYADLPIPLPPLAEQQRIVAKVDELMAVCDALEAELAGAATERARLLEAALHAALGG